MTERREGARAAGICPWRIAYQDHILERRRTGPPPTEGATALSSRFRTAVLAVGLILAGAVSAPGAAPAAPAKPAEVVAGLNAALIDVMRNAKTLGYRGRFDRLAPVLSEAFNFPVMAGISVGRYWSGLSEAQRKSLVDAFGRMSVGTFAERFNGYSGERFEVTGEEDGPRGAVLVRNRLVKSDGDTVEINYLMKQYGERWRAVDVYLDSKFSELAIKRSEYSSVIQNEGFDALIKKIEAKLAAWAAEG